jgi:ribonuclease E
LNEKRTDVLSIETRFKVNVLLVPNRHLETPNYNIERLRHDDLNQGEPLPASFQLVSQPQEPDPVKARKEELREVRHEAVVKGITPAQPAPIPLARSIVIDTGSSTKTTGGDIRAGSWLSKILAWFRNESETRAASEPDHRRTETFAKGESREAPASDSRDPAWARGGAPRTKARAGGSRPGATSTRRAARRPHAIDGTQRATERSAADARARRSQGRSARRPST